MWKKLPEDQKKVFNDQYQETKKKYDKAKEELKSKSDEESDDEQKQKKGKIKFGKVKAETKREEVVKNNLKVCNCGRCAECKKLKAKRKNPEEDESKEEKEDKDNINGKLKQKPNENTNRLPLNKNKDISQNNKQYKFTVGSRKLKAFGKGGKLAGAAIGAVAGAIGPAVGGAFMLSPICAALGAYRGVKALETIESVFDQTGALHVCLLLGDDIFEYGDEGYARHKNVGKTSEYDWNNNFGIEGVTKVTPDELEEKIIQTNEWVKDKYDKIIHNCHTFVKFCCDIIEPDPSIMSVVLIPAPQDRLFRAW